jgi:SAM-dependent methyltransferase
MRERWAEAFTARAAAYWTPERVRARLGEKQLLLEPVAAAPLLRALGIFKRDASMTPDTLRKYMQINHMVLLLKPLVLDLSQAHGTVRLLDAGCGSSYLTLLLAWCFKHIWQRPAQIIGVDRNADVIERCRKRAELAGLGELLRFEATTIDALDASTLRPLHGLVSLHACDTATDDALALGLALEVELLAAAPCCQVELSRKLAALEPTTPPAALSPLWKIQHLRREAAATMTDMLRTLLLRGCGYRVTPMEFVPSEHTPKNTLLRAMRCGPADPVAFEEYLALRRAIGGVGIRLEQILPAPHRAALALD